MNLTKLLRTPFLQNSSKRPLLTLFYWPSPLLLTVSDFQPAIRFRQRCFSVNFAKFWKTYFDRTPPDDCFFSLSVNFENFSRTTLLYSTSEKLHAQVAEFHVQVSEFQLADAVKNYFTDVFQVFWARTRSSHSNAVHGKTTYDCHTDDIWVHTSHIWVHTSYIPMTCEYIRVTYGWHTSTYQWHTVRIENDINIRLYKGFEAYYPFLSPTKTLVS